MIKIICANDTMEIAFLPDTPDKIINKEIQRVKTKYNEQYKWDKYPPNIYVHIHEVELWKE